MDTPVISPANHNIICSCRKRPSSENHPTIEYASIPSQYRRYTHVRTKSYSYNVRLDNLIQLPIVFYASGVLYIYILYLLILYIIIRAHACEWRISAGQPPFYFYGSQHDNDIMTHI